MNRIYHPYWDWEDFNSGMWAPIAGERKQEMIAQCIEFMEDTEAFGLWMVRVSMKWEKSSEHNLTAVNSNRRAWIGQAASCMALGAPEQVTREAWHELTSWQRKLANKKADIAIKLWENAYNEKNKVQEDLF